MGRVFVAHDRVLGEEVAVKVLRPAKSPAEREAQLFVFQAEVRSAASLCHPRVVPLYDAGSLEDDSPFYTMRLVAGGSLAPLRAAPPPWPVLHEILDQVLDGLAFAHARGVVHRDIKPHNILLEPRKGGGYEAFLADLSLVRPFGVSARSAVKGKRTVSISGTPPYMAPEQYDEEGRDIGPWTDLYSVGVMIFEIVAGYLPFEGDFIEVVFAKGTKRAPQLVPRPGYAIPKGLDELVAALLEKNPASRFELAADVRAALAALGPVEVISSPKIVAIPLQDTPTLLGGNQNTRPMPERPQAHEQSDLEVAPVPRPAPMSFPPHPPPDPGRGAYTRAALSLYAYRRPPLVGREALQKRLWEISREVLEQKKSRIVLLEGEAGVGKSRLATWLAESLEACGAMRVIQVTEENAAPLSGVAGGLSRLIGGFGLEKGPLRNRIHAYLKAYGAGDEAEAQALWRWLSSPSPEDLPPEEERYSLFSRAASRVAWRGATCIWLDDIPAHRIPEGLLRNLLEAASRQEGPFLILITPREEGSAPAEEIAHILKRPDALRLPVERLTEEGCLALAEELLSLTPSLHHFLARKCGGNPLFAVQLAGHWIEAQLLEPDPQNPKLFRLAEGVEESRLLPPSITEIFRARAAEVIRRAGDPEATQEALHIAALLGMSFSWGVFVEALEKRLPQERARIGAWAAAASGLIQATQGGRAAAFDNAMLRETLREEALERADAPALQRALAQVLERRAVDLETLAQAAEFWEGAGDGLKAARTYLRAGRAGFRANIERTSWALERALALAQGLEGSSLLEAHIHLELARSARLSGKPEESVKHAETALALEPDNRDIEAEARLALGQVARQKLDHPSAIREFSLACEAARAVQDKLALAKGLLGQGDVAFTQGDLPLALTRFQEAHQLTQTLKDPFLPGRVLNRLGDVYRASGDMASAASHYGQARIRSSQRGDRITELTALSGLGDVAMATGDLLGAVETFEEAYRLSRLANFPEGLLASVLNLAAAYLELREPARALAYLKEGEGYLPEGSHWARPLLHLVAAWGEAMRGEGEAAQSRLKEAQRSGLDRYNDPDAGRAAEGCGDEALARGHLPLAALAFQIAIEQFAALGREADVARLSAKEQGLGARG